MNTIAKRIKHQRKKLAMTQKAFAQKMGYSQSYLNDIECGAVLPSSRFLLLLGETFDISIDAVLFGRRQNARTGHSDTGETLSKALCIVSEAERETGQRLNEDQRRAVIAIVRSELEKEPGNQDPCAESRFTCECGRKYVVTQLDKQ